MARAFMVGLYRPQETYRYPPAQPGKASVQGSAKDTLSDRETALLRAHVKALLKEL
jgi:hypothetical protein